MKPHENGPRRFRRHDQNKPSESGRIVETVGGRRFRLVKVLTTRQAPGGPVVPDVWSAEDLGNPRRGVLIHQNENGTWTDSADEIVAAGATR